MGLLNIFKTTENLKEEAEKSSNLVTPEYMELIDLDKKLCEKENNINILEERVSELKKEEKRLLDSINGKKKELVCLNNELIMQEFNLYNNNYDFINSNEYKEKLNFIRKEIKDSINNNKAVNYFDEWIVNYDIEEKRRITNNKIKQILMAFNSECENVIEKVKPNNIDTMEKRILKCFERLNKLNEENKISITQRYLDLRIEELHLVYEYETKRQQEKEELKRRKEEIKDKEKFQKEVKDRKSELNKKIKQNEKQIFEIEKQLLDKSMHKEERKEDLKLKKALIKENEKNNKEILEIEKREKKVKSGYIYVLSNIGSFGENVFKIDITTRLNPESAIEELNNSSVPFSFDVHAIIYTEDVFNVRNEIYRLLNDKKVNKVFNKGTFFYGPLKSIEKVMKQCCNKDVSFTRLPEAKEYRISVKQ